MSRGREWMYAYTAVGEFVHPSEQPTFRERQAAVVADDEVIQHADVDQRERIAQTARDELVCLAGLGDARTDGCARR